MALTHRKRILASFLVATMVLLAVSSSVYASFREMNRQKAWVDHTYEVLNRVDNILSNLKDIQSSQRGYLITGLQEYLAPYYTAIPKVNEDMETLGKLISDNPKQIARFKQLEKHVNERVRTADEVLNIYKDSGQEKAFDRVKEGTGKREMDEVRFIAADMIAEEQKLLNARQLAMNGSSEVTTAAGIAGLAICFIILVVVFMIINREAEQRVKTEGELKKALEDMEMVNDEIQLMGRIGDYLRACKSEEEAFIIIEKNMPLLFPYTYGSISMFRNSRNALQTVLKWGSASTGPSEFEPEDCWALRQGRIHQHVDNGTSPVCEHLKGIDENTVSICLPMQAQGEIIGQICLASANRHALQEHNVSTLRTAGEQISLALANIKLQQALKEQSIKDALTKLFNRRYLEETAVRELARSLRNAQPLAVLMMDIDHFKKVNDTYGHDGGDDVLIAFAKLLSGKIRKEDIACRLGGEEFVLVMPAANQEQAKMRAEEICEATRKLTIKFQTHLINITVSIGVAIFPEHGETLDDLLQNADLCLYKAKNNGRNQVVMFDDSMYQKKA